MKLPEGYQAVMPYLLINDASKFLDFMEKVFHAKLTLKTMLNEKMIRHAEINIGGSTIMLSDSHRKNTLNEATFMIYVDNADVTYKKAIEEGARAVTKLSNQQYGRSGCVTDPFGITWWITSVI